MSLFWFYVVHVFDFNSMIRMKPACTVTVMSRQLSTVVHMDCNELVAFCVDVLPTLTAVFILWCHDYYPFVSEPAIIIALTIPTDSDSDMLMCHKHIL